ncbi:hypothetical protein D3C72_1282430 [compost metagenome]
MRVKSKLSVKNFNKDYVKTLSFDEFMKEFKLVYPESDYTGLEEVFKEITGESSDSSRKKPKQAAEAKESE